MNSEEPGQQEPNKSASSSVYTYVYSGLGGHLQQIFTVIKELETTSYKPPCTMLNWKHCKQLVEALIYTNHHNQLEAEKYSIPEDGIFNFATKSAVLIILI